MKIEERLLRSTVICQILTGMSFNVDYVDVIVVGILKSDLPAIRRPTHRKSNGTPGCRIHKIAQRRDLNPVCSIHVHLENSKAARLWLTNKSQLLTVRRPHCVVINDAIVRQPGLIRAVRVHHVDLLVAVTVAGKGNLAVSAKRRRVEAAGVAPTLGRCLGAGSTR